MAHMSDLVWSSTPRKREPSMPQRFDSIAGVSLYWTPAYAGMTTGGERTRCETSRANAIVP